MQKLTPLTAAVISILAVQHSYANETDNPHVELGTMVVNIDRQGTKTKTNVVTSKAKDESTATDLRGLLREEPAIDFAGGNGTSQYITIRGMGQNSIDVKVDNAYSDAQILYHQGRFMLDPSLVKIVSVQKGAGSASAGIGATNGAIVAKTVDANDLLRNSDKDYGFKVNAGYASNDEHSYGVSAFGRTSNFDILIAGNHVEQNNYKAGKGYVSPVDGGKRVHHSALDKTSYLAKIGTNIGDHRFVLSHYKDENKGTRNIREEFDWFNGQDPQYRKLSMQNTNLEWTGKNMGFINEATANIYLLKNIRKSDEDGKTGYAGNFSGKNKTTIETKGANINFDSYVNDAVLLKYGVNYRHQEIEPNRRLTATDIIEVGSGSNARKVALGVNVINQEKTDIGIYTEAIADIGPVTATLGVRYDHFNFKAMDGKKVSNGDLNPSIGLIWQALPSLSFTANHNYATRSPRLYDALTAHGKRGIISIADGTKAEKAQNTEVGFNYNRTFINGARMGLNGSYFWQTIDNLLNSATATHHTAAQYQEIRSAGWAKNHGFEVNASYQLKGLTARIGVAESNPKFYSDLDSSGRTIARFSNRQYAMPIGRTWTAGLSYRFDNPNLELGARHRLVEDATGESAWQTHMITNNSRANNDLNLKRDGYNVTDVYANWKPFNNDKVNINFAVNNVGNKLYRSHSGGIGHLYEAGRDFRIGVNFTY